MKGITLATWLAVPLVLLTPISTSVGATHTKKALLDSQALTASELTEMVWNCPSNFSQEVNNAYSAISHAEIGSQNPWIRTGENPSDETKIDPETGEKTTTVINSTGSGEVQATIGLLDNLRKLSIEVGKKLDGERIFVTSEEYDILMKGYSRMLSRNRNSPNYIDYGEIFDPNEIDPRFESTYERVFKRYIEYRLTHLGNDSYALAEEWRFGIPQLTRFREQGLNPRDLDHRFFREFDKALNSS